MIIVLKYLSGLSVLIPLIFSITNVRGGLRWQKAILIYAIVAATVEIIAFIFHKYNVRTHLLYIIFTFSEFSILSLAYLTITHNPKFKKFVLFVGVVFLCVFIILVNTKDVVHAPDNVLNSVEAGSLILFSSIYLYLQLYELNSSDKTHQAFNYINSAILIYFSTTFFLFLFSDYIEKRGLRTFNHLYVLNWITNIIFNLLISFGIWKTRYK